MTVEEWLGNDELRTNIWYKKYQRNNETFEQWLDRVSGGDQEVRQLIVDKKFLFGGRILSNRGISAEEEKSTLSNCYVIEPPEDNIESIYKTCGRLARTFSYGGGCGIDISNLSPKGAKVRNQAKTTSGAVSFMSTFAQVPKQIGQNGRRGALMISMDVSHPDILDFIDAKKNCDEITSANISVRVSDDFMRAVDEDACWTMKYIRKETGEVIENTVKARKIFDKLCENNWAYAEPGILFWDRIKNWNMQSNNPKFSYAGVNPCGEEPLPSSGSCNLGALNLAAFVDEDGLFDVYEFGRAVKVCIYALNRVLDEGRDKHPLIEQRKCVTEWNQVGLGIMGLGDCLIKQGIRYGSDEAYNFSDYIGTYFAQYAILASEELAFDKNKSYVRFNKKQINSNKFVKQHLPSDGSHVIEKLANSQLLTIAPTGSISTMLGVSGGIEPIFANTYTRKTESLNGETTYYDVVTPIFSEYMEKHGIIDINDLPEWFVTSAEIPVEERIQMQAAWQNHIDASISSTINLPESATVEDIKNLYMKAWKAGLKGVTVYRANCSRAGVLVDKEKKSDETATDKPESPEKVSNAVVFDSISPVSRKTLGTTHGRTYCKKCACGTLYITLNRDDQGHIVESFINTSKGGVCQANISAVNRLVSLSLRSGVRVDEIIDQIHGINCKACTQVKLNGTELDGLSCPDILARTLKEFILTDDTIIFTYKSQEKPNEDASSTEEVCPECGSPLVHTGGCVECTNCPWSRCG